jgi:hypothetical protein
LKVIDAVWEKRNLGVTCFEVTIETTDTLEDVKNRLPHLAAQYVVIKVPTGRSDIMFCISEMGYIFIEGSIHITRTVKNLELFGIQKRLADSVGYALMDKGDIKVLQDEIRKGMHDTDRIYLDANFTRKQSAERYIGWIQDEIVHGSDVYKLTYKGESIGYFTMKDLGDGVYYPFLAGMYKSHNNSGLGFNIAYKPMCEIAARGGKLISTYISTNNERVVRILVSMGFSFDQINYVYVKHNDLRI